MASGHSHIPSYFVIHYPYLTGRVCTFLDIHLPFVLIFELLQRSYLCITSITTLIFLHQARYYLPS